MQDKDLNEMRDKIRELSRQTEEIIKIFEPFASGDYVAIGIPKEVLFEIGAKMNDHCTVDEKTAFEFYTEDDKIILRIVKDTSDYVCGGDCEDCPIHRIDCDGNCGECPCADYCEEKESF